MNQQWCIGIDAFLNDCVCGGKPLVQVGTGLFFDINSGLVKTWVLVATWNFFRHIEHPSDAQRSVRLISLYYGRDQAVGTYVEDTGFELGKARGGRHVTVIQRVNGCFLGRHGLERGGVFVQAGFLESSFELYDLRSFTAVVFSIGQFFFEVFHDGGHVPGVGNVIFLFVQMSNKKEDDHAPPFNCTKDHFNP